MPSVTLAFLALALAPVAWLRPVLFVPRRQNRKKEKQANGTA